MTLKRIFAASLVWSVSWGVCTWAHALLLKDGSVLTGRLLKDTGTACTIQNPLYGDIEVPKTEILYQDTESEGRTECFVVTRDGTVLARYRRTVPDRGTAGGSFRLLIPGRVQSVLDPNGATIPFAFKDIGDNCLVTIAREDLPAGTRTLTLTSLAPDLVLHDPAGTATLRLKYQLDQAQSLKVLVRLPAGSRIKSMTPEPKVRLDGLIVWEQTLQRQQQFSPEVVWIP